MCIVPLLVCMCTTRLPEGLGGNMEMEFQMVGSYHVSVGTRTQTLQKQVLLIVEPLLQALVVNFLRATIRYCASTLACRRWLCRWVMYTSNRADESAPRERHLNFPCNFKHPSQSLKGSWPFDSFSIGSCLKGWCLCYSCDYIYIWSSKKTLTVGKEMTR